MDFDFLDSSLVELFEQFLDGFSEDTKIHYIIAVRDICLAKGSFLSLTSDDVLDYFLELEFAESTKSTTFYCLRSFSVFLEAKIDGYVSPFVFLGLGSIAPDYSSEDFPEEKLPDLFRALADSPNATIAVQFAIYMCLSVSEISDLRPDMFSFHKSGCTLSIQRVIPTSQSDGVYRLPVPDLLIKPIRARMKDEFILPNRFGKQTSVRSLQSYLQRTGTPWTFQRLRTYGMLLRLRVGYSELEVAEYAGVDGRWLYRCRKLSAEKTPEYQLLKTREKQNQSIGEARGVMIGEKNISMKHAKSLFQKKVSYDIVRDIISTDIISDAELHKIYKSVEIPHKEQCVQ